MKNPTETDYFSGMEGEGSVVELDEMVREFLIESTENLEQLDRELLALEANPSDLDTINVIFRIIHTVKGTCGFFEFSKLESVSHVGENLLDSIRSKKVVVTDEIITALLKLTDTLRELLGTIASTGDEGDGNYDNLVALLTHLNEPLQNRLSALNEAAPEKKKRGAKNSSKKTPATAQSQDDELEDLFASTQSEWEDSIRLAEAPSEADLAAPINQKRAEVADTTLRVDIALLDKLMNLVGELVLARNQILQFTKSQSDGEFVSTSQRLNLITSELQDGVMRTRMQPIATVWNKFPRIVRDIAHSCQKEVVLETHGKETELDKTIIEAIKDPLTHILRNSVDHGIEMPSERQVKGKSPIGKLTMRAFHEGGQVIIEISDDGGGLNSKRIKAKALEKGLVTAERAEAMAEADINRLVFVPGFSTAEHVTNLSGRGVGMDVVRSNIERIGGTVDIASKEGSGSTVTIRIPLTLAIIPALIVTSGKNRYAIPQVNLLELVRLESSVDGKGLERVQDTDFYRLRGKLLPLVYLYQELRIDRETSCKNGEHVLSIVVVRADHHQFGLVVDAIHDTEEIVVKPLGKLLKGINSFAGVTIMGDGQVALILDVVGIGRNAHISRKEATIRTNAEITPNEIAEKKRLLLFALSTEVRGAVPLDQVYRLEEFPSKQLEKIGGGSVVQYRGGILPLIDIRKALLGQNSELSELIKVFVYNDGSRCVGFVVDKVLDIVEQEVDMVNPFRRKGVAGTAIIQDRTTDIIDLEILLQEFLPASPSPLLGGSAV